MEYSAHRVRSKTRAAVKRREDDIVWDELESGELNLIPYLDMVTNLMLFLLASVSAGIILVQIDIRKYTPVCIPTAYIRFRIRKHELFADCASTLNN